MPSCPICLGALKSPAAIPCGLSNPTCYGGLNLLTCHRPYFLPRMHSACRKGYQDIYTAASMSSLSRAIYRWWVSSHLCLYCSFLIVVRSQKTRIPSMYLTIYNSMCHLRYASYISTYLPRMIPVQRTALATWRKFDH